MGLSICRSIIDAHGGRLWADGKRASRRRISVHLARCARKRTHEFSTGSSSDMDAEDSPVVLFINWLTKVADDPSSRARARSNVIGIGGNEDRRNRVPRIDKVFVVISAAGLPVAGGVDPAQPVSHVAARKPVQAGECSPWRFVGRQIRSTVRPRADHSRFHTSVGKSVTPLIGGRREEAQSSSEIIVGNPPGKPWFIYCRPGDGTTPDPARPTCVLHIELKRIIVLSIATRWPSGVVQHKVQIAMQELAILFEIDRH